MIQGKHRPFQHEPGARMCCGICSCYVTKTTKFLCCSLLWVPILAILALLLTLLIRAALVEERFHLIEIKDDNLVPLPDDSYTWAGKLAQTITIETISTDDGEIEAQAHRDLHAKLESLFPAVYSSPHVHISTVNDFSLLFEVKGSHYTDRPYLLAAHLDVVPAGDVDQWDLHPFLGEIINQDEVDYVYGRGAIDDKHSVVGILEALEQILKNGDVPKRSFYIALGHDEEIGGENGAGKIAEKLEEKLSSNNQTIDFLLDEGTFVIQGVLPGMEEEVIYISVVEKGWAELELSVEGTQHHSSFPPRETTIGILANGLSNLENNPHPSKFNEGPEYDTINYLAPYASFLYKVVFSNLWLLSGAVQAVFSAKPEIDSILRTTTAITIVEGGFKHNVIPGKARAIVNHRIHPRSNLEEVLEHDKSVINDDRVKLRVLGYVKPPPVSPYSDDSIPFQIIVNSASQVFPKAQVTPGTLMANTDTKHYLNFTNNIYRFTPVHITNNDTKRFHGANERISVKNFGQVVNFYYRLMKNSDRAVEQFAQSQDSVIFESMNNTTTVNDSTDEAEGSGEESSAVLADQYDLIDEQ